MTKRKWVWLGAISAVAMVLALAAWRVSTHHDQSSPSDCQVVRAMIDYNRSQGRILAGAFKPEQGSEASVSDYQDWANHLQGYAARIRASDLAIHAHRLADEANQMVELVKQVRSDTSVPADPGAPPSWAQPYAHLSTQFHSELVALNKACPG
jgi:hypothetical protein